MANSENIQAVIQAILKKLVSEYSPPKVILFGSYAYGTPRADSDIDLLIVKETSQRFIDRWETVHRILTSTDRIELCQHEEAQKVRD